VQAALISSESAAFRLYFLRHGESEANVLHEFSNRPGKHPLTEKGRQQAKALADQLRGASIRGIYCSPVLRALQTAEILSDELGVTFAIEDALREFDVGVLEGKSDQASWDLFWQLMDAWLKRGEWERRIEGGESFVDIRDRFVPFVESLVRRESLLSGGLALVGHGGTYRCMLPLIFSNIDFEFPVRHGLDNAGVIVGIPSSQGLVCLSWGDTPLQPPG
jgi:broad specificity phosphatase PhoE